MHLIAGARRAAVRAHRHHRRRSRRTPDGRVDDAALFGDVALDHPVVGALHQSLGQLDAEVRESLGRLGDDQDARGSLVQAVHDARAHRIAESLVTEVAHLGIERQETSHQRAVAVSGAGVHHLARRLVNDREVDVVEHDVDVDAGVGLDVRALGRRARPRRGVDPRAPGVEDFTITLSSRRDRAAGDDVTRLGARQARQQREHAVECGSHPTCPAR
jgi:hypothetical protein